MRKTNKILSLILAFGMLLTLALPTTVSAAISFSDVSADHTYYSAITNLSAEGILNGFEDGSFKPDEPVTRAQFTKIICYAQGVGGLTYSESERSAFPDVAPDHWAIHNIITAQKSKIIKGYDDGLFRPENPVLYEQAVKMAVCALGYPEERIERNGGYPRGYLNQADKSGLLKKMGTWKIGEKLSRGGVAQLIDNMMDAELYRSDEDATGGGDTMRDQNADTDKVEGRIVAIYGTSIYYDEESGCNRKQIEIEKPNGDREYYGIENLDLGDLNNYLGRSVTVYYNIESGADYYEAYNIAFQKKKNYEVAISLDSIESYTAREIEYYDEEEEDVVSIDVSDDVCIIHNGQAVSDGIDDLLDKAVKQSGSLTLVCSGNDETVDVVFLRTYETIVVNSKDSTNYKIYDKYNSSRVFVLDETDRTKTITFTKDGKKSNFAGISVNNIVSVSTSKDGNLIDVQISTKTKTGTISEIAASGKIALSGAPGTYYSFSDSCNRSEAIAPGTYLTLYLDAFGQVARYVISAEKTYIYGYLASAEDGTMSNPKVDVMVYKMSASNSTLSYDVYSLKDNVKIDGTTYSVEKDSDKIMGLLAETAAKSGVNPVIDGKAPVNATYAQPIRFTTSASNVIDHIRTINSTGEFNVSLNMVYHVDTPLLCKADKTTLDKYSVGGSVPVLLVPSDRLNGTYMSKNNSYFEKDEEYYVQLVNVNSANQPLAIYVYGTVSGGSDVTTENINEDNKPMIVTEVTPQATYMDEVRIRLTLKCVDGTELKVYDDSRAGTEIISSIAVGDVIRVAADGDGLVDAIELIVSANNVAAGTQKGFIKVDGTKETDDMNAPYRLILGMVRTVYGQSFTIAPSFTDGGSVTEETYTNNSDVKIYIIDSKNTNKPVDTANYTDIIGYKQQKDNASKVMVYTVDGDMEAIIIFK